MKKKLIHVYKILAQSQFKVILPLGTDRKIFHHFTHKIISSTLVDVKTRKEFMSINCRRGPAEAVIADMFFSMRPVQPNITLGNGYGLAEHFP